MNERNCINGYQGRRFQWGSYGFLLGILVGVLVGWSFAGFIGAFIRVAMVSLVVVPIVLFYFAWRKVVAPWLRPAAGREYQYIGADNAIETRAVVHGAVAEPRSR